MDNDNYYYNGKFIVNKFASTNWFKYSDKSVTKAHADVICNRSTNYRLINNLKSTSDDLDLAELVTLGRDILKNTSNYYIIQTNDSTKNKPKKSLFDAIFKAKY